ncbi:MAG: hypothetical protein ACTH2J_08890 [Candidatus Microbacterium stercoravium]
MPQPITTVYALLAGVLMATFQLLRPWGDVSEEPAAIAEAFADTRWVIAHLAGAASFVMLALLAQVVAAASPAVTAGGAARQPRVARTAKISMAAGALLILPYYGAETFALHEIGRSAVEGASIDVVGLSGSIRMNIVAVTLFGIGLLLIAVAGICLSIASVRAGVAPWGAWPIGVLAALALPQFALPPVGRMAYGVAFLIAAILFAVAASTKARSRPLAATGTPG